MTTIYALVDPRDGFVRYVGKTERGIKERLKEHRNVAQGGRKALRQHCANWLRNLYAGGLEPRLEVLEDIDGDWAEAERFWIGYLRFLGCRLTNHTDGGEGLAGMRRPRSVIEKTAAAHRGRKRPQETCERLRLAWTPERRAANGARLRGTRMSDEARQKMRASAAARWGTA